MSDDAIRVQGLRELQQALRRIDKNVEKELKNSLREAAKVVAEATAQKVPKRTGRAAASVKPRSTGRGASIALGGSRAPYYPWLDFGGSTKVPGAGNRVQRDRVQGGRYLYPALTEKNAEVLEIVDEAMERLAERHGITTRGGV